MNNPENDEIIPLTLTPVSVTTFAATIELSIITLPDIPDILARLPDVLTPILETTSFVNRVLTVPLIDPLENSV